MPQRGHGSPSVTSRRSAHWRDRDVPLHVDAGQVHVVGVGAGGHPAPAAQREVREHGQVGDADRAEAARQRAERRLDFVGLGRADRHRAGRVDQLLVRQRMVAAQQHQRQLAVDDLHQRLDLPVGGQAVLGDQVLDGPHARRVQPGRAGAGLAGGRVVDRRQRRESPSPGSPRSRSSGTGATRSSPADDGHMNSIESAPPMLPLDASTANRGDAEPGEDPLVGVPVPLERGVKAGLVDVEAVGVLHRELADPQQAALRPRLVPELGLELVPELGQLAVGGELWAEVGEDLLVRHAEHDLGALAVLEAEHLLAHDREPAGLLPDLGGLHARQQELLRADPVHLLADDLHDLRADADAERQQAVVAGHQLADEAGPQQQPVARARPRRLGRHGAWGCAAVTSACRCLASQKQR